MTSTRGFFDQLKATRDAVGLIMGMQVRGSSKELRALANSDLVGAATVFKALLDKGVLTDADVSAAIGGAVSGDGSFWDPEPPDPAPEGTATWDDFPGETFEAGVNGLDATDLNTAFGRGQVGDLAHTGSATFDSSTALAGSLSLKVISNDGFDRALGTADYAPSETLFTRWYFKAAGPPPSPAIRVLALYDDVTAPEAFEVNIEDDGKPSMFVRRVAHPDAGMPYICDGVWWRVETGIYATVTGATCELRLYTGAHTTGTTIDASYQSDYDGTRVSSAAIGHPNSRMTGTGTWTAWFDNVAFSTVGWIGP